jgi:adenylate kinase
VLRCETEELFDRLTERGYSEKKRRENVECEIFGVVAEEANESYDEGAVFEFENNTKEQMAKNITEITRLIGGYSNKR